MTRFACPVCQSKHLQFGHIPGWRGMLRFIPRKWSWWSLGVAVLSFACLNCGYVGSYLHKKDVLALRAHRKKQQGK